MDRAYSSAPQREGGRARRKNGRETWRVNDTCDQERTLTEARVPPTVDVGWRRRNKTHHKGEEEPKGLKKKKNPRKASQNPRRGERLGKMLGDLSRNPGFSFRSLKKREKGKRGR